LPIWFEQDYNLSAMGRRVRATQLKKGAISKIGLYQILKNWNRCHLDVPPAGDKRHIWQRYFSGSQRVKDRQVMVATD
jgi:hypothetical protein